MLSRLKRTFFESVFVSLVGNVEISTTQDCRYAKRSFIA